MSEPEQTRIDLASLPTSKYFGKPVNMSEPEQTLDGRKFFVITFVDELSEPDPQGKKQAMQIAAFVPDMSTAERKALIFAETFPSPTGRQVKLSLQSITYGGTILT
jgi:hypothetical protein